MEASAAIRLKTQGSAQQADAFQVPFLGKRQRESCSSDYSAFAVDDGAFLHKLCCKLRRGGSHVHLGFFFGYWHSAPGYDEVATLLFNEIQYFTEDLVVRHDLIE